MINHVTTYKEVEIFLDTDTGKFTFKPPGCRVAREEDTLNEAKLAINEKVTQDEMRKRRSSVKKTFVIYDGSRGEFSEITYFGLMGSSTTKGHCFKSRGNDKQFNPILFVRRGSVTPAQQVDLLAAHHEYQEVRAKYEALKTRYLCQININRRGWRCSVAAMDAEEERVVKQIDAAIDSEVKQ